MISIKNTIVFLALIGLIFMTALFIIDYTPKVFGEVAVGDQTIATSTPQLADRTNLCPQSNYNLASSTTGTLDFITIYAPLTADLLIMDATTTNASLRLPAATSSNILAWFPAGTGTTTVKMGVQFNRGLLVDYGTGIASTTIGYRCGS